MTPDPLLPFDEGAAPLPRDGRAENEYPDDNLARLPLRPPARRNAPRGTSKIAADRIAGHAAQQRAEVLEVIVRARAFGATDAEIELVTGIRAQSVSPRRGELRKLGLIVDSGRRRPTPRGRPAAVWVAVTNSQAPVSVTRPQALGAHAAAGESEEGTP